MYDNGVINEYKNIWGWMHQDLLNLISMDVILSQPYPDVVSLANNSFKTYYNNGLFYFPSYILFLIKSIKPWLFYTYFYQITSCPDTKK